MVGRQDAVKTQLIRRKKEKYLAKHEISSAVRRYGKGMKLTFNFLICSPYLQYIGFPGLRFLLLFPRDRFLVRAHHHCITQKFHKKYFKHYFKSGLERRIFLKFQIRDYEISHFFADFLWNRSTRWRWGGDWEVLCNHPRKKKEEESDPAAWPPTPKKGFFVFERKSNKPTFALYVRGKRNWRKNFQKFLTPTKASFSKRKETSAP